MKFVEIDLDSLVIVYGLLFKCPYNKELDACPFYEVRKLAVYERLNYIKTKTNNEI